MAEQAHSAPEPREESGTAAPRRPRLDLSDPVADMAGEDRPESWGDAPQTHQQRLADYRENRPPHHG